MFNNRDEVVVYSHQIESDGKSYKGKKNIYVCEKCKGHIVTEDRDTGVTPFLTSCKVTEGCKGMMQSSMYRVFDQSMEADYEWYRPDNFNGQPPGVMDHLLQGGLLIRKIERV